LEERECEDVSQGDVKAQIVSGKVVEGWGVDGSLEIYG